MQSAEVPDPEPSSPDPNAWQPPTDALFGLDGTGAAPPVASPFPALYPPPYPDPVDPAPDTAAPGHAASGPAASGPATSRPAVSRPAASGRSEPGRAWPRPYSPPDSAGSLYAASDAYHGDGTYRAGDTNRPGVPRRTATTPAWMPPVGGRRSWQRPRARRIVPFVLAAIFLSRLVITFATDDRFHDGGLPAIPAIVDESQGINAMLGDQSVALVNGDKNGFLAPVDPSMANARRQYEMLYANLRALHVAQFSQTAQPVWENSAPPDVYHVAVSYCLGGEFCRQEETAFRLTVHASAGTFRIEAYAPEASDLAETSPLPWEVSTLHVRTGKRVTLMASDAEASQLATVLPVADAAAATADRFAVLSTPPDRYDIYLASPADARIWFGGDAAGAAGSVQWADIGEQQAVVVLPDAMRTGPRGGDGLVANLGRVLGLLASQQDMFADAVRTDALTAGLGDYVAYLGHDGADADRLAQVAVYVRSGHWAGTCDPAWTASASPATIGADTGIGYLALRRLVQRFGLKPTLDFWGDIERSSNTIDASSQIEFGQPWAAVDADCVSYVHRTVGA